MNRWYYDPDRGISINTKNPQRAKDKKTLPMEQLELDGIAVGGRVVNTDGSSMKSSRLLLKQQAEAAASAAAAAAVATATKQAKDDNKSSEDEDSDCAIILPRVAAAAPKKRKGDTKKPTANIEWTKKLRNSLIASINKHQGKAHNKGIAWDEVEHDMALPKNDLKVEWRKIQKVRKQEEEEDVKVPAVAVGEDNVATMMTAFQDEMRRELRDQQEEIKSLRSQTEERDNEIRTLKDVVQTQNQREAAKELEHQAAIANLTSKLANENNKSQKVNRHFNYSSSSDEETDEVPVVDDREKQQPAGSRKQRRSRRCKRAKTTEEDGVVMTEQELRNYGSALAAIDENAALKKEIFLLNKIRR